MNTYPKAVRDARYLVRSQVNALLSTLSVEMAGWPFGSVTPYILDFTGQPILLLSDLAQHTRNLLADNRVSLLVWEQQKDDIQQAGRATLLGRIHEIAADDGLRDRYLRYLPQAQQYFGVHDFRFYRLAVERVRYIGGFGDIHWIKGEDFVLSSTDFEPTLIEAETGAVIHMNSDHKEALVRYCRAAGVEEIEPRLLGIDSDGFDVQTRLRRLRIEFITPVRVPTDWRTAFIALSKGLNGHGTDLPSARAR